MQKRHPILADSKALHLNSYFAKRVTDQVRHVMGTWRLLVDEGWPDDRITDLQDSIRKLIRYAQHFQEDAHLQLALKISYYLTNFSSTEDTNAEKQGRLTDLINQLASLATRKNDVEEEFDTNKSIPPKKPIYIAMANENLAKKIQRQLDFFGYKAEVFTHAIHFQKQFESLEPTATIMDINLEDQFLKGIDVVNTYQKDRKTPIPTIFYSNSDSDIHTLLKASRAHANYFHCKTIEMSRLIEEIEQLTDDTPEAPYRVLVVEDSKTQAFKIEKILNSAGMVSKAILDPMLVLEALEEFQPEIILMDMYMPVCNGVELANVIRQQDQFVSIPIVFLSAEDDIEKQLDAMSKGGDDFLTKPIKPTHLITAVRNKGRRTRQLLALVNQDSLTGLLNHTSILKELENEIQKAKSSKKPLCFAMLDIDHFKNINDTYGHPVGDLVIKNLAMFLKQRLRKTDYIGRYGGEEFAVALPNTTLRDGVAIFEEIRKRFSQLKQSGGSNKQDFNVTFSCGVIQVDEANSERVTVECDEILYDAKRNGRNRVCYRQAL